MQSDLNAQQSTTNDCEFDMLTSVDEKIAYLNSNNKWLIDVILTFNHREQDYFFHVVDRTDNDTDYLHNIFYAMDKIVDFENLVKISVCHNYSGLTDLPEFILDRNGKYYFNNKDEQSMVAKAILDAYIKNSVCVSNCFL